MLGNTREVIALLRKNLPPLLWETTSVTGFSGRFANRRTPDIGRELVFKTWASFSWVGRLPVTWGSAASSPVARRPFDLVLKKAKR
jgi:hypothetical protein